MTKHLIGPCCPCPCCGVKLNGASNADEHTEPPRPGDISMCLYCGALLEFGPKLERIKLSDEVFNKLPLKFQWQLQEMVAFQKRNDDAMKKNLN